MNWGETRMLSVRKTCGPTLDCWLLLLSVLLAFVLPASSADVPSQWISKLKRIPACPALATTAQTNHIPMDRMDPLSGTNALHPGDSVTMLGTLTQKDSRAQWLLYVEVAAPDPGKTPAKKPSPFVVTIFGTAMKFESKPVPAKLRMLGPYSVSGMSKPLKPEEKDAQFSLNESFLSLGLEQAAAVWWQWNQMTNTDLASSNSPPAKSGANKARDWTADRKPTAAEQRALAGSIPALMSYFEIVQHTEGLEKLLFKLVKLPSLWSVIRHAGVRADILLGQEAFPADPKDWNLPASVPVYYFPCLLRINGQPAMKITFVVTSPQPPLLVCGGVVGLLAEKLGDDETYMTLRIISAQCKTEHED